MGASEFRENPKAEMQQWRKEAEELRAKLEASDRAWARSYTLTTASEWLPLLHVMSPSCY